MGENKGHGVKGPRHDDDVDELSMNTASGKPAQGGQQQSGNMQSGQQQGSMQSGQQQGSRQSGQRGGSQQSGQQQQGSQQSGQQSSRQSGGQHASGGTPALDDLGARQGESAKDASQAWSQDDSADQQRGNR